MIGAQRKITSSHLQRLAVVYLRQSTPAQVRLNVRSTERQYAIAGEAARLGWESERIVVVDHNGPRGRRLRITSRRHSPLWIELDLSPRSSAFADALVARTRGERQ